MDNEAYEVLHSSRLVFYHLFFNIRNNILRIADTPLSSLGSQYNAERGSSEHTPVQEPSRDPVTSRDLMTSSCDDSRDPASLLVENVANLSVEEP